MYHIHYYILSVYGDLPACLPAGWQGEERFRISIYPYHHISDVYTTYLAPSLLQFAKGLRWKRQSGCHTRRGRPWGIEHGSKGLNLGSGGGRRWSSVSWVLRRPPSGGEDCLTCVGIRDIGMKSDADWTVVPVRSPGLGIGSGLIGAPARSRYLFGYLRARAYIPLEVEHRPEHRPTPEIEGILKVRFAGVCHVTHHHLPLPRHGSATCGDFIVRRRSVPHWYNVARRSLRWKRLFGRVGDSRRRRRSRRRRAAPMPCVPSMGQYVVDVM